MKCLSLAVVVLLFASPPMATLCLGATPTDHAPPPNVSPAGQLPRLAVTVSAEDADAKNRENLEDLLSIELGNQRFLQLVDRQNIQAILKEHAIALTNLKETAGAVALGKFAGADYLLHVLLSGKEASLRLIEVATGQVKLEQQLTIGEDLPLVAASIRERVLAAVQPESQAARRLTVGIAGFPNRSGADRSDELDTELQVALRKRLKDQPWAIVLERQYPMALLEEVNLARMGLVRDKTPESLPPADLVVLGTMQDVDRTYIPGKPWKVKLDLTCRLRGQTRQINRTIASDAVDAAASEIVASINEFRRNLAAPQNVVAEKELWRRQGLYLMPASGRPYVPGPYGVVDKRTKGDVAEMLRAWENVLLLDGDDAEAITNVGLCRIALNEHDCLYLLPTASARQEAVRQCVAGSQLVERALRVQPSPDRAAIFASCAVAFRNLAPDRAKEMARYIADHRQLFANIPKFYWDEINLLQKMPALKADDSLGTFYGELDLAIRNAEKNPDGVLLGFERFTSTGKGSPEENIAFLTRYFDWPDPVVQFEVHKKMGDLLCWQKNDPAGLAHFDRAIDVMEPACKRLTIYYRFESLHDIYRLKIIACEHCGRPEEAKKTALAGARRFLKAGECDIDIGGLFHYCVTRVLGDGDEREALAMCDAYVAGMNGPRRFIGSQASRMFAKREELLAKLAGKSVPGQSGLQLARGTESRGCLMYLRMAATTDRIWLAVPQAESTMWGDAKLYRPSRDATERLSDVRDAICCVAAAKDAVFFGSLRDGLYKLDGNGRLVKHYSDKDSSFPLARVVDLREGGGNLYLGYCNGSQYGVAAFNPASDSLTVLAPTSREAKQESEPVADVGRVWWDAVAGRLYASCHEPSKYWNYPQFLCQYGLLPDGKRWQKYQGPEAPRFIISDGDETLVVRVRGKEVEFSFSRSGQKFATELPLPSLMGDPAWDEHRIWIPTAAGLYEIDRATHRVTWLAYQNDNPFLSVLKHENRLYVATGRGLYYRAIP